MLRKKNFDLLPEKIPLAGRHVLDVGCGDGGLARAMARLNAHVTGIDTSPRQLAKARQAEPVADEGYVDAVAQALPFADHSFDVVVFANSLHHVPVAHQDQALAEASRVLVSGGMVYVSEPIAEGPFFQVTRLVDDETEVRAKALDALRRADRWGLRQIEEFEHINPVRQKSFEAFMERMAAIDVTRDGTLADLSDEIHRQFLAHGQKSDDGWTFDQPTRVSLFQKI